MFSDQFTFVIIYQANHGGVIRKFNNVVVLIFSNILKTQQAVKQWTETAALWHVYNNSEGYIPLSLFVATL